MISDEGVIKFRFQHRKERLSENNFGDLCCRLSAWRQILSRISLLGKDPEKYGGAAYGNLSARVGPFPGERGVRRFLITGSSTSGRPCVSLDDFCVVEKYDARLNFIESFGFTDPSSESMTHGCLYDLDSRIRFVFHVHAPSIWQKAEALQLPATRTDVAYGTPEMARETVRLFQNSILPDSRLFVMGGHEDGVVAFGETADSAAAVLLNTLARAYELECREKGELCAW